MTNWKNNVLPELQKGDVLYNNPIGGDQGQRSMMYQRMGFGKSDDDLPGQRALVGHDKDGNNKIHPINPAGELTLGDHRRRRHQSIIRRRQEAKPPEPKKYDEFRQQLDHDD